MVILSVLESAATLSLSAAFLITGKGETAKKGKHIEADEHTDVKKDCAGK